MTFKQLFKEFPMGSIHTSNFDYWIENLLDYTISDKEIKLLDGSKVIFSNTRLDYPKYVHGSDVLVLTPEFARRNNMTYGGDLYVDASLINSDSEVLEQEKNINIGTLPIMLKSNKCHLKNKSIIELKEMGENPNDIGCYFIVNGQEKIVPLQEKSSLNRIFYSGGGNIKEINAKMTVNVDNRRSTMIKLVYGKNNMFYIYTPSIYGNKDEGIKLLNVLHIFNFLGTSDISSIMKLIMCFMKSDQHKRNLSLSILSNNIIDYTKSDSLEEFTSLINKIKYTKEDVQTDLIRMLNHDIFPHMNNFPMYKDVTSEERVKEINVKKTYLLAIMLANFLEACANVRNFSDRDSWANKRLEGAANNMENLLRGCWRKMTSSVNMSVKNCKLNNLFNIVGKLKKKEIITESFLSSFVTPNWAVKGETPLKTDVAQALNRDNHMGTLSHIFTVNVNMNRLDRQMQLRLVQNSQFGYIDPVFTTENENSGILKNLAISCILSKHRDDTMIIRKLIGNAEMQIKPLVYQRLSANVLTLTKVMINGKFIGWDAMEKNQMYKMLIKMKRRGEIPFDVSISTENDWIYVDSSASRPIRPLLKMNIKEQIPKVDLLKQEVFTIKGLLQTNCLEFVSPREQDTIKLASSREKLIDIKKKKKSLTSLIFKETNKEKKDMNIKILADMNKELPYTHCELDPKSMLGVVSAMIPLPNHNQAPRNTYQVAMSKQALGSMNYTRVPRFLHYPQDPVVYTSTQDLVNMQGEGVGNMLMMAMMMLPGNEEDAFVVKKSYVLNGGLRMCKRITYSTKFRDGNDTKDNLENPKDLFNSKKNGKFEFIRNNGLPKINTYLREGDCVIGKVTSCSGTTLKSDSSIFIKPGDDGVVEKISIIENRQQQQCVIVQLRKTRLPKEGDKFAPRCAQKGTIGICLDEELMYINEAGLTPDLISNSHCMPRRMTLTYIYEIMMSSYSSYVGKKVNGDAFVKPDIEKYQKTFSKYGRDKMCNSMFRSSCGRLLVNKIYFGPCFFQALKHHVDDKIQCRSTGNIVSTTRQPVQGKGVNGGLKFGEMERDSIISHGASSFLRERTMLTSDAYEAILCKKCGFFVSYDSLGFFNCKLCNSTEVGICTIPFVYKHFLQLVSIFGVKITIKFLNNSRFDTEEEEEFNMIEL